MNFSAGLLLAQNLNISKPAEISESQFLELLKKAESGDAEAQAIVGARYMFGVPKQSDVEAIIWITKSAQQGYKNAKKVLSGIEIFASPQTAFFVSRKYLEGIGIPQDYELGKKWLYNAAERGYPEGQAMLGLYLLTGTKGFKEDFIEGHKWCNLAASKLKQEFKEVASGCREDAEDFLTEDQLKEAQKRASKWTPRQVFRNHQEKSEE